MRKSIVYMVVVPASITNASSLTVPLKKYFRDLSIVYKVFVCSTRLGVSANTATFFAPAAYCTIVCTCSSMSSLFSVPATLPLLHIWHITYSCPS